jgi:RNA polymerase sigma factor (sigma-70 family)
MILQFSDEELIEGLRQRKKRYIEYMYQEFVPIIRHFLLHNSGNQQDVEDLFQDAILALYTRSMVPDFTLDCSLKTYFVSICKNIWLQRLERKCRLFYQADYEVHEPKEAYSMEDSELLEDVLEIERLFYKHLQSLPVDCRRLIELYCLKVPVKEIVRLMNYKTEIYVRTRKYSCKNLLRKRIMNDPECHQFLDYEGL